MTGKTFTIIYIENDQNNIESLRNVLRVAGVLTNLQSVSRQNELQLKYKAGCDLIIINASSNLISLPDIKSIVNDENAYILCLGNQDTDIASNYIKEGADYFAPQDDKEYVAHVIKTALNNIRNVAQLQSSQVLIEELSIKSSNFIEDSSEPIAYLSDGVFSFVNDAFKNYFGDEAVEDSVGIGDFLSDNEQRKYIEHAKKVLETQTSYELMLSINNPKLGKLEEISVILRPEVYQEENCIAFIIVLPKENIGKINEELDVLKAKLDSETQKVALLSRALEEKANESKFDGLNDAAEALNSKLVAAEQKVVAAEREIELILARLEQAERVDQENQQKWAQKYTALEKMSKGSIASESLESIYQKRIAFIQEINIKNDPQSWLVLFNLGDVKSIWRRYGCQISDEYMTGLIHLLRSMQPDARFIEYAEGSFLMYVTNLDLLSINSLTDAIRSQCEGYSYTLEDGTKLFSKCLSGVMSISNSSESLVQGIKNLEVKVELFGNMSLESLGAADESEPVNVDNLLFDSIADALENKRANVRFVPIVSFGTMQQDHYYVEPHLLDGAEGIIDYRLNQSSDLSHPILAKMDRVLIQSAVDKLIQTRLGKEKVIFLNLSLTTMQDPSFLNWLKGLLSQPTFPSKNVAFGISEYILCHYRDAATQFLSSVKKMGAKTWVAGLTGDEIDILSTLSSLSTDFVMISERVITRVSRSRDDQLKLQFKNMISDIMAAKNLTIAMGVDAPAQMALIWEYNIPLALGAMIGGGSATMDFNFDSIMV